MTVLERGKRMGGIVSRPASLLEENSKQQFFKQNAKILASNCLKRTHPQLIMLRMILQCEYGRPKLIQHLIRTTAINSLLERYEIDNSFLVDDFKSKFQHHLLESTVADQWMRNYSTDLLVNFDDYIPQFIVLAAISAYHSFLKSPEHTEWLRFQHMLTQSSSSNSERIKDLTSVSKFSSHRLAMAVRNSNYNQLLTKSHWIVALADLVDRLPFPVSILGRDRDYNLTTSQTTTSSTAPINFLYGNELFVQMVGYTQEEIAQHPYDKYHSPATNEGDGETIPTVSTSLFAALSEALNLDTKLRIGTLYFPRPPLAPFLNLQSYLPLFDPDGNCNFFFVVHCNLWRHHRDSEYIQKLDFFTEILSKAIIPHRESAFTFLKSYFYHKQEQREQEQSPPLDRKG
jgi:hypothetical protein